MLQPGTVYVLGAGTSAGLVPFTSGTLAFVRRRYAEVGVYAVDSSPSPLLDRVVIGPMVDAWKQGEVWFDEDLLVEKIPSSTLELLVQKAWSPCRHGTAPPQYSLCRKTLASEMLGYRLLWRRMRLRCGGNALNRLQARGPSSGVPIHRLEDRPRSRDTERVRSSRSATTLKSATVATMSRELASPLIPLCTLSSGATHRKRSRKSTRF